jgi:triacylglycerol lipase
MGGVTGSAPSSGNQDRWTSWRLLVPVVVLVLFLSAAGLGALAVLRADAGRILPSDPPVPVVLVHGYGGSTGDFRVLAPRLAAAGFDVVPVPLPERNTGDLRASARALAQAVRRTGASQIDVVGFSAGGVVARLWLRELGGVELARHVVLLGSPNHGAGLAEEARMLDPGRCLVACEQLVPSSPLLAALNRGDETPDGPTWTTVWTQGDEIVTPPESARLDGAVNVRVQDVCPGARLSHGDLARDPLALGLVLRALQGRLDKTPGADDCDELRELGG